MLLLYLFIPYGANFWWRETLANLVNHWWFTKLYQPNFIGLSYKESKQARIHQTFTRQKFLIRNFSA